MNFYKQGSETCKQRTYRINFKQGYATNNTGGFYLDSIKYNYELHMQLKSQTIVSYSGHAREPTAGLR